MGTPAWATLLKRLFIGLLITVLAVAPFGCTQTNASEADLSTSAANTHFDKPVEIDRQKSVEPVEPPTLDELQEALSRATDSPVFESMGNYVLSSTERVILEDAAAQIEEQGYSVGALLFDISTGQGVVYNIDEEFYSASTVKGIYAASLVAQAPETMELWGGSLMASLQYSSDEDYIALQETYKKEPFLAWCIKAGVDESAADDWFPYYSARTLAKLWLQNYAFFDEGKKDAAVAELATWYEHSLSSAISKNLGEQYRVYSKGGWINDMELTTTADAGIVYAGAEGERPYIMVILSDMPSNVGLLDPLVIALDGVHANM